MNIGDFFSMTIDAQEEIIRLHAKRTQVKRKLETIKQEQKELSTALFNLQFTGCTHPVATSIYKCEEDEYGRRIPNSSYREFNCPDCEKRWTVKDNE